MSDERRAMLSSERVAYALGGTQEILESLLREVDHFLSPDRPKNKAARQALSRASLRARSGLRRVLARLDDRDPQYLELDDEMLQKASDLAKDEIVRSVVAEDVEPRKL